MKARDAEGGRRARPVLQELEGRALLSTGHLLPHGLRGTLPFVQSTRAVVRDGELTGLVLKFSHPMNPGPLADVSAYHVTEEINTDGQSLSVTIPLGGASYDPHTRTLALVPTQPLPTDGVVTYNVYRPASATEPLADTNGVRLDGTGVRRPTGILSVLIQPGVIGPGPQHKQRLLAQSASSHGHGDFLPLFSGLNSVTSPFPYLFAAASPDKSRAHRPNSKTK